MSKGKHHRLKLKPRQTVLDLAEPPSARSEKMPVNFLLNCSDHTLGEFELKRLDEVAHLRAELHETLDRIIDEMAQAGLAAWFRTTDRNALKHAIENPPDVEAWAKEQLRKQNRQPEEGQGKLPSPSDFRPSLPPGAAHMAAALRYQQRNVEEGKCCDCPEPLDPKSVRYCTTHLAIARERMRVARGVRKPQRSKDTLAAVRQAKQKLAEENANLALAERLRAAFPEAAAALATQRKCRLCDEPVEPGERHCARHLAEVAAKGKGRKRGKT